MSLILSGTNGLSDVDGSAATPAIRGTDTNTGIFFPAADTIAFAEGGVEAMRLDSSGNMGLGVTPSAWSNYKALQFGGGSVSSYEDNNYIELAQNSFYAAGAYKYVNSGFASKYQQNGGTHQWYRAASGTAGGTISFTQAMTLDASGNLLLGATSARGSSKLDIRGDVMTLGSNASFYATIDYNAGAGLLSLASESGGGIAFKSGTTERARIDTSGNLLVGTTTAYGKLTISGGGGSFGQPLVVRGWGFGIAAAATWRTDVTWSGNADIMYFDCRGTVAGSIVFTNSGTTVAYTSASDYRLKENVQPLADGLDRVMRLKPVTYTWIQGGDSGEGFIAHELQEVCPQAVNGEKDAVNQDGSVKAQSVDTSFLVATLTAAIQEQQAIITQLQADIETLKGKA